jgi:AmmeMemoRadiSam system protein B
MSSRNNKFFWCLIIVLVVFFGLSLKIYFTQDSSEIIIKDNVHKAAVMDKDFFTAADQFTKQELDLSNSKIVSGIIPHHLLAADLISEFFYNLKDRDYETVVLLGPNHFNIGQASVISSEYNWQTPYGVLSSDNDLLQKLLADNDYISVEEDVIKNEHSISSEVAFIKKTFSNAKFVPVIISSYVTKTDLLALANSLSELAESKNILVLASVDFSHYKDSETAQINDQQSMTVLKDYDFDKVFDLDIDSPASIYTLLKFNQQKGAEFKLLQNSNSAILAAKPDIDSTTSYITAYFIKEDDMVLNHGIDTNIKMLFWGDLMLDRHVGELIGKKSLDYLFDKVDKGFFEQYDLVGANLEGAVTNGGIHYDPVMAYDFAFNPDIVEDLKKYNFNFFNIANNHINDQGLQGIKETKNNLTKLEISFSGCKEGQIGDCSGTIVDIKGKQVAFLGLSTIYSSLDMQQLQKVVGGLLESSDFLIANIHWGVEYENNFNTKQQELAHALIDMGVDCIIGHHPHVVQGVEVYKNKPIFYSLGNFIFDQYFSAETQTGLAIALEIDNKRVVFKILPFKSNLSQLEFINGDNKKQEIDKIKTWSRLEDIYSKQLADALVFNYD